MKRYINRKKVSAILFLIVLFGFGAINTIYSFSYLRDIVWGDNLSEQIAIVDTTVEENIVGKYQFIEANGFIYDVLHKKEMNDFSLFKDDDGMVYLEDYASYVSQYNNEPRDMAYAAEKILNLQSFFTKKGTPMLFTLYPDKMKNKEVEFKEGYPYNYANETMDSLKNYLGNDIPCLDFRDVEGIKGKENMDIFYKTDHHWKIESAFIAFQNLVSTFNTEFNMDLDPTGRFTNEENYNRITYPSMFIGSLGRKTGTLYAGADDFTLIYPKFSTNFKYYYDAGVYEDTREGKFEYSLINPMFFNDPNKYGSYSDTYATYLYGNHAFASIENKSAPNDIKVLFIKDSFSLPMISFFANTVKQVDLLDPRFYKEDIETFLDQNEYDYVVFGYSESVIQVEYIPMIK